VSYTRRVDKQLQRWAPYEAQARRVNGHLGALWDLGLVQTRGHAGPWAWQHLSLNVLTLDQRRMSKRFQCRLVPDVTREMCLAALQLRGSMDGSADIQLTMRVGSYFTAGMKLTLASSTYPGGHTYTVTCVEGNRVWVKP